MLHAVEKLAGKWEDFGVSLGVNVSDLEAIHSAKTHTPKDCLKDMLKLWLRQCYNVGNDVFVFVFFFVYSKKHQASELQCTCFGLLPSEMLLLWLYDKY